MRILLIGLIGLIYCGCSQIEPPDEERYTCYVLWADYDGDGNYEEFMYQTGFDSGLDKDFYWFYKSNTGDLHTVYVTQTNAEGDCIACYGGLDTDGDGIIEPNHYNYHYNTLAKQYDAAGHVIYRYVECDENNDGLGDRIVETTYTFTATGKIATVTATPVLVTHDHAFPMYIAYTYDAEDRLQSFYGVFAECIGIDPAPVWSFFYTYAYDPEGNRIPLLEELDCGMDGSIERLHTWSYTYQEGHLDIMTEEYLDTLYSTDVHYVKTYYHLYLPNGRLYRRNCNTDSNADGTEDTFEHDEYTQITDQEDRLVYQAVMHYNAGDNDVDTIQTLYYIYNDEGQRITTLTLNDNDADGIIDRGRQNTTYYNLTEADITDLLTAQGVILPE